jgi:ABC-type sulfate transport system permease subunit
VSNRLAVRGLAFSYLAALLIIPLAVIVQDGLQAGPLGLWRAVSQPVAWSALMLALWTAAIMALINAVMGTLTAWVLVRYHFPGKALLNAVVDIPFAIPTLVAGVMLVVLYGPQQPAGAWLERTLGMRVIFAPPGIILALLFVTFPFVARAVQPVLMNLDRREAHPSARAPDDLPARGAAGHRARWSAAHCSAWRVRSASSARRRGGRQHPFRSQRPPCTSSASSVERLGASAMSVVCWPSPRRWCWQSTTCAPPVTGRDRGARAADGDRRGVHRSVDPGPLGALVAGRLRAGRGRGGRGAGEPDVRSAFERTLLIALITVAVHTVCGTAVAWVLVRHEFPGKRLLNSLIDLPFAVSPVVAGYMLILLFGRRGLLAPLTNALGVPVAFALPGMILGDAVRHAAVHGARTDAVCTASGASRSRPRPRWARAAGRRSGASRFPHCAGVSSTAWC